MNLIMQNSTPAELAHRVAIKLRRHGHQSWLVGGSVRDRLLGRQPKDFDVATDATPDEVIRLFPEARLVGAHFGVVLIRENGAEVEVATLRTDHSYRDGRRPEMVVFQKDPRQDALRRDFTINALFEDPSSGEVLDFTGGKKDLEARVLRAIGDPDRRFAEDYLRMLRAVRLAAELDFTIEPATAEAIRRMSPMVRAIAAERVREELNLILTSGAARRGFEWLDETGLLVHVLPEIAAMKGVPQPPEFHPEGDVWTHTLLMLGMMHHPSVELAWGVLLHDVGKPPTFRLAERIRFDGHVEKGVELSREILQRLRAPNSVIRQVESLVANHLRFKDIQRMKESTLKRFLRLDRFEEHLELHRLDCLASHGQLDHYEYARRKWAEWKPEELKPPRLIGGDDLICAGYAPGPQFRRMLAAVEDAQLEGRVRTPQEALALIAAMFGPPGQAPESVG